MPKHTLVYEIIGPMFFAAADKFLEISAEPGIKVVIIRMRGVPAMDVTALRSLTNIHEICKKKGITLVLSHVQEQPRAMMEKAGFVELVGEENFCANIDAALAHAAEIDQGKNPQNTKIQQKSDQNAEYLYNKRYSVFLFIDSDKYSGCSFKKQQPL